MKKSTVILLSIYLSSCLFGADETKKSSPCNCIKWVNKGNSNWIYGNEIPSSFKTKYPFKFTTIVNLRGTITLDSASGEINDSALSHLSNGNDSFYYFGMSFGPTNSKGDSIESGCYNMKIYFKCLNPNNIQKWEYPSGDKSVLFEFDAGYIKPGDKRFLDSTNRPICMY